MKKTLSAILVCILMLGCVLALASCGDIPGGKYESKVSGIDIEISGDRFIVLEDGVKGIAKYKVEDNKITLTFDKVEYVGDDADEREEFNANKATIGAAFEQMFCGEHDYEKTDDGFKMGIWTFEKK